MNELDHGEYWHGTYKGVGFKIVKWPLKHRPDLFGHEFVWNYYIYLNLDKINEADAKKLWIRAYANKYSHGRKMYRYYDCKPLTDIEMQGGITWYKKSYGLQDEKIIEIGCDYNHAWNDREYQLEEIYEDLKQSIESVLVRFPELNNEN